MLNSPPKWPHSLLEARLDKIEARLRRMEARLAEPDIWEPVNWERIEALSAHKYTRDLEEVRRWMRALERRILCAEYASKTGGKVMDEVI